MRHLLATAATAIILLSPGLVLAADETPTPAPDASQQTVPASGLGPQTSQTGGASSADGSALQPAGTSTLQSGNQSGSGLTASPTDGNSLQQPATSDNRNLQVFLQGEGGGRQEAASDATPWWEQLALAGVGFLLVFGGIMLWRRASRAKQRQVGSDKVELAENDGAKTPSTDISDAQIAAKAASDENLDADPSKLAATDSPESDNHMSSSNDTPAAEADQTDQVEQAEALDEPDSKMSAAPTTPVSKPKKSGKKRSRSNRR